MWVHQTERSTSSQPVRQAQRPAVSPTDAAPPGSQARSTAQGAALLCSASGQPSGHRFAPLSCLPRESSRDRGCRTIASVNSSYCRCLRAATSEENGTTASNCIKHCRAYPGPAMQVWQNFINFSWNTTNRIRLQQSRKLMAHARKGQKCSGCTRGWR